MKTVQLVKGRGNHPWFLRLVGANGEVLAVSEGYVTRWGAKRAAAKNFAGVRLVDLSRRGT